jgi:hypothetical protein
VALFLRALTAAAGLDPATLRVAGRPVRFAGEVADDAFGEVRLRQCFAAAGFRDVALALESEGAGWRFARSFADTCQGNRWVKTVEQQLTDVIGMPPTMRTAHRSVAPPGGVSRSPATKSTVRCRPVPTASAATRNTLRAPRVYNDIVT